MPFLQATGVSQEFNGVRVLDAVDIAVEPGRFHILAGENGAGKSTLVKILTGVQSPVEGQIRIRGEDPLQDRHLFDEIAYVPQELSLFTNLTVAENLFLPFGKHQMGGAYLNPRKLERAAKAYLEEFHIEAKPSDVVSRISVSDCQLIQIARAVSKKTARILILDEPTSSLTQFECDRLFRVLRRLAAEGTGIIFISHKMEEIFDLGDDVTVLRNGRLIESRPIEGITEQQLVSLMAGDHVVTEGTFVPAAAEGETMLQVENLHGRGFSDVSFQVRRGEILGFAGLVGAGRSELMQSIFGYHRPTKGKVLLKGATVPASDTSFSVANGLFYISEERSLHGIFKNMSVYDNIALTLFRRTSRAGFVDKARERSEVAAIIDQYGVRASSTSQAIRYLSGGNQQKAIIGRALATAPDVLIFDEPTKGIDVRTKLQIYDLMRQLAERGAAIILVSSEMTELHRCASRIITMCQGRLTGSFDPGTTTKQQLVTAMLGLKEAENGAA